MRPEEVKLVKYGGYGLFNKNGDEASDTDREITVMPHIFYSIPLKEPTLIALVLDRYVKEEYTVAQVKEWLLGQAAQFFFFEEALESICSEQAMEYSSYAEIPEKILADWLLKWHQQDDFFDDTEEWVTDASVAAFISALPDIEIEEHEAGWMGDGLAGDFTVPVGQTLSQLVKRVTQTIDEALLKWEPEISATQ